MLLTGAVVSTQAEEAEVIGRLYRVLKFHVLPVIVMCELVQLWCLMPPRGTCCTCTGERLRAVADGVMQGALAECPVALHEVKMASATVGAETIASLSLSRVSNSVPAAGAWLPTG